MPKKTKAPWVIIEGVNGKCTRCGDIFDINSLSGQKIGFVVGAMKAFVNEHSKCKDYNDQRN